MNWFLLFVGALAIFGLILLFESRRKRKIIATAKAAPKPPRHELEDIPVGSMIELSDPTTFETSESASRTFALIERKKYEARNLSRYMYLLEDGDEKVVLGIDRVGSSDQHELTRWMIDDEAEKTEDLPNAMTLYYPDPDDDDAEIAVEYTRQEVIPATLTLTNSRKQDTYRSELHEYTNTDGGLMSVELTGDWLTFYVGETISRGDVDIYPVEEEAEYI